jgi:hypothetical protein
MRNLLRYVGILLLLGTAGVRTACALDVKVSSAALERTLRTQLFSGADGRYYMRGNATSPCFVYAEDPHVSFKDDRIVVHVRTKAKLGTALRGACLGVTLTTEADVSVVPEAQGVSVGFRDARIEKLSDSKELNFLLEPFLSRKLPSEMKLNAEDLMRKLLSQSATATGYTLTLDSLTLHSMLVDHEALVVDVDADMSIQ